MANTELKQKEKSFYGDSCYCLINRDPRQVILLIVVVFIIQVILSTSSGFNTNESVDGLLVLQPAVGQIEYHILEANSIMANNRRRKLAPFQLCLLCKCCASGGNSNTTCISMPCCFGIDCELPNKPFGVCAFVPKTCNCTTCAV
ncbi:Ubiquitin carboxyl-terminal hydrolase [Thalictrum thalictroides]|uniref:Ubiquitin carboxyl-terminal hydrolase n=1 Tax=Thalictrum thalictroides TaxID=46969 RepID=A0A7J6VG56_THATH|nr:Ubiquitin carboxyl-terminal hydrolase [Thalictrum thalictroides]